MPQVEDGTVERSNESIPQELLDVARRPSAMLGRRRALGVRRKQDGLAGLEAQVVALLGVDVVARKRRHVRVVVSDEDDDLGLKRPVLIAQGAFSVLPNFMNS